MSLRRVGAQKIMHVDEPMDTAAQTAATCAGVGFEVRYALGSATKAVASHVRQGQKRPPFGSASN